MTKYILVLCLLMLSCSTLVAQEKTGVKSVISAAASQQENIGHTLTQKINGVIKTFTIQSVSLQVGLPYLGILNVPQTNNPSQNYKTDLGFPWGIRYRYNTFSEDAFSVSKGYYSDKIEINWDIKMNRDRISSLSVYRTEDISSDKPIWGKPLKILAADAGSFEDTNTEGGKLYRYKIAAKGVEIDGLDLLYTTYITGIGYRNPTGVITGNISFKGGNPVKDVMIVANPTGNSLRFGSALKIPAEGYLSVPRLKSNLKDFISLQTWIKPESDFNADELTLYSLLSSANENLDYKIKMDGNELSLSIGDYVIRLTNYIPSGEIDNKGDDLLVPIIALNSTFTHFSAVVRNNQIPELYINGRLITAEYAVKMNTILSRNTLSGIPPTVTFSTNNALININTSSNGASQTWNSLKMGGGKTAFLDEFRIWETALSSTQIQRDYRRYIKGNESYLNTYIRANESVGDYAYDLAHSGFNFHSNDAKLSNSELTPTQTPVWTTSDTDIPTASQLGVLGISDEHGNYVISAVPYSGNGDSFTIVPSLGKHEFNPTQELAFLGIGSTVVNNVDFIDKSSFVFKGIAVYDSRGVFPATSDAPITGDIKDNESYNAYIAGDRKYQKGEYWAEKDANGKIIKLIRYAAVPVPDAYVSIDNVQALDINNVLIKTDINGRFEIEVPIGKHAISLSKAKHNFEFEGRYPAKESRLENGETYYTNTYLDFYEDRDEPITFIDNTKVIVVGRVVGGSAQSDKTIGFGFDGKKTYQYTDGAGVSQTTIYSSINNIGTSNLTIGYQPPGATSVTPEYQKSFSTNSETGEYRISLLPLKYILFKDDLTFKSGRNPDNKPLLEANKTLNFTEIKVVQYPIFTQGKDTIKGEGYQEILKFTHMATPELTVLKQTSDTKISVGKESYELSPDQTPIYTQFGDYTIELQSQEHYTNYDTTTPVVSIVPVKGGTLMATNNLALADSEKYLISATDPSKLTYSFKGGMPNTDANSGFKRSIDLKYRYNDVDYLISNYQKEGIVLGGESDGSQTFVTAGPDLPDFVLRDPPGSGSSATIEKGSSFSFTKENTASINKGEELNLTISSGVQVITGGGLTGPVVVTETTNDIISGVSMSQSSTNGKSVTNTYSFNQTISTSDDPSWVGSDADLYIGTSSNQFYGTYNELVAGKIETIANSIGIKTKKNTTLYLNIKKAMYFTESPEKTLFVYSQHTILNEIIPKYLEFIEQIESGALVENKDGVLTKSAYKSSINLWRKVILNNELAKYDALSDKEKLKSSLNAILDDIKDPITSILSSSTKQKKLKDLLNKTFFENISIDAGIGEFTKGFQIGRISSNSLSFEIQIDNSIGVTLGQEFFGLGFLLELNTTNGIGMSYSSEENSEETTNISYTLKDNDTNNLLSVDVINAFDGNGPIFITKGGETSCPHEAAELSHFYNPTHTNVTSPNASIIDLPEDSRIALSKATMALEQPEITVNTADVTGVFEGRNAEFVLNLRNTSSINKDAVFKIRVDQSTNPDNAAINIEPNGTLISIPAGKTVTYTMTLKKVKLDQFDYKNIRVFLESNCDDNAVDEVLVSANFVPACSPVTIMSPSNNWLMNRNTSFDVNQISKPVTIKLGDFNTSFASFQKINLEYRLKGTPNWNDLRTYFKKQEDLDLAFSGGNKNCELIKGTELNYAWDIAGLGLADGSYELRARTSCNNQTAYESEIIEGSVDLFAPVLFGTPTPKNGILNLGDDLTLRFNEPVKTNGTITKFEFLVQKNQLPVVHEVSLAFSGSTNTASINKPALSSGDFSIEFWLKNSSPSGTSTLLNQNSGIKIELIDRNLKYTIGGQSISATIMKDNTFNHYALSYDATGNKLTIIENSTELQTLTLTTKLNFTNENPVVIGGNTFKGNLHDLRFWKRNVSREASVANMNSLLNGNETDLLGYWPMNEGNGIIANDLARFKHLVIANTNWDINPKGNSYAFDGSNYLSFSEASKVIISKEMDATLSFWMKTNQTGTATLLSNGKGDLSDLVEGNGYRNKWAINLNANGGIELQAEARTYPFGSIKVNTNSWHNIALSLTRNGSIRMYVDGNEMGSYASSDLGGFSSSTLFVGVGGQIKANSTVSLSNYYVGFLDELCIWNSSRNAEQIKTDQFFELNYKSTGLLLYSTFNKPELDNANGPKYFYPFNAFDKASSYASLNSKPLAFSEQTPAIKLMRPTESIVVNAVINQDELYLSPQISNWASVEGKVAYITVSNLNDRSDNRQVSPVSWTALINKNPIKWFVEGQGEIVNLMKRTNDNLNFEITLVNQGGLAQPYTIDLPNWLTLSARSGTIAANTTLTLKATVDNNLAIGNYNTVISLTTNYGYNEKIQLDLRVLEKEPILDLDPSKFTQSMNVIGKVKVDGIFTNDLYDKVVGIVNGQVRAMTNIIYEADLDEYYVYLTVYSNVVSGEQILFYIWDASDGKLKEASLDNALSVPFLADNIIGSYTNPAIFNNTAVTGQQILLKEGWTWVSFNVNDSRFSNLNLLTSGLVLGTSNLIQSNSPALFDAYQYNSSASTGNGWSGGITTNGGISNNKMYKIKLSAAQKLNIKGIPVDLNTWFFDLNQNWNWLPFVVSKNVPVGDALANLDASDGDLIKSQSSFAIYSPNIGWKGSLSYLKAGEGYMLKTSKAQQFTYPEYLNRTSAKMISKNKELESGKESEVLSNQYAQFPNTMSAVVKLPSGFENLAFYNETGQLRGNTITQNIEGINLAFITIYGNQPETLTAYIGKGINTRATAKSIPFSTDAILGSIADPILIDLSEEKISVFPNPFYHDLEIAIETKERGDAKILIYNILGQIVFEDDFKINSDAAVLKINPAIPSGVYLLKLQTNGKVIIEKIIKN